MIRGCFFCPPDHGGSAPKHATLRFVRGRIEIPPTKKSSPEGLPIEYAGILFALFYLFLSGESGSEPTSSITSESKR